jgi:tetratricopeptide (TPR) repeat protein
MVRGSVATAKNWCTSSPVAMFSDSHLPYLGDVHILSRFLNFDSLLPLKQNEMSSKLELEELEVSNEEAADKSSSACCANCGIAEVDDVVLEECGACKLVRYCSDKCREEHREEHEEECKKRHDEMLFTQPESCYLGDCSICLLPLPLEMMKSTLMSCCGKDICSGCVYATLKREGGQPRCPFCRTRAGHGEEVDHKRLMKRVEAGDLLTMCHYALVIYKKGDHDRAIEYWKKAVELGGYVEAHFQLGCRYQEGEGVEKDMEKAVYHMEIAAIGGHHLARCQLAFIEHENDNMERSVKHYIIAAKLGYDEAMKMLWAEYRFLGNITKEELETTLRVHQAAVDATKSPQRKEVEDGWLKQPETMEKYFRHT